MRTPYSKAQHISFPQLLQLLAINLRQDAQLLWATPVKWVWNAFPAQGMYDSKGWLFPFAPWCALFTEGSAHWRRGSEVMWAEAAQKHWGLSSEAAGQEDKLTEQISKYIWWKQSFVPSERCFIDWKEEGYKGSCGLDCNKKNWNELMLLKYIYTDRYWNSMGVCMWCIICSWYVYRKNMIFNLKILFLFLF